MTDFHADMADQIQGKRRFSRARPGGDNNEFRVLEACGNVVQVREARFQAADGFMAAFVPGIDPGVGFIEGGLQGERLPGNAHLCDVENLALSRFQEFIGRHRLIVGVAKDFVAGMDQIANDGLVANDAGVILGIGGSRRRVPEFGQIGIAADVFEMLLFFEVIRQEDEVNRLALVVELGDAVEDFLVAVGVKRFRTVDDLNNVADNGIVTQHAAQDAAFGIAVLRWKAIGNLTIRSHEPPRKAGAAAASF